jgi:glycosyltransferase involved in cell wall biosynthesis
MPPEKPRIAFYAPLKPPDHPTPSGDRTIARLMMRALDRAGFEPILISRLRSLDKSGHSTEQQRLRRAASVEIDRCAGQPRPALWFTYHSHYKAPDLLGPRLADHWGIFYVIAEPSHSPTRLQGPWAEFAEANTVALQAASRLLWTTERDRPALDALVGPSRLTHLPAFLDVMALPTRRPTGGLPRLLTVAMMREGDKLASFRALAAALHRVSVPFDLTVVGDGAARATVEALLAPFTPTYLGQVDDPALLRAAFEASTLFVWPGVGEGVGMVYLEAQAAALACVAEDRAAQAAVLGPSCWRVPADDPESFAAAIAEALENRAELAARGLAARTHVEARHSLDAAAARLRDVLTPLLRRPG